MSNKVLNELKASKRTLVGTNAIKKLRAEKLIPGVLYGHELENVNIQLQEHDFDKFFRAHGTGSSLNLNVDGQKTFVLFKDVQLNRMKNETTHVEFQALSRGKKIKLKVPIHYTGIDSIPAGIIFQPLHHEVEMTVLPKDIIEEILVDVSSTQIGDQGFMKDLEVFKNEAFDIVDDADTLLYVVSEPSLHVEETDEEDAAAEVPEIGKED